eukprot:Rhum_TRINITY_DN12575_c0_g1::Rhum_TRINITY_DN12575_c0_g1_i1::g.52942::m.52942
MGEPQERWAAHTSRDALSRTLAAEAAACGLSPTEHTCLRAHFKQLVGGIITLSSKAGLTPPSQLASAVGALLFARFTTGSDSCSIATDVHADILACACASVAVKLCHLHISGRALLATFHRAVLDQLPAGATPEERFAVQQHVTERCTVRVVTATSYFVLERLSLSLHSTLPFPAVEALMLRLRATRWRRRRRVRRDTGSSSSQGEDEEDVDEEVGRDAALCGELEHLSLRYCHETFLSDVNLYAPPWTVALACVQRAVAVQGALPMALVAATALLEGEGEDGGGEEACLAAVHADMSAFYRQVEEVKAGASFAERSEALARQLREKVLRRIPDPVTF